EGTTPAQNIASQFILLFIDAATVGSIPGACYHYKLFMSHQHSVEEHLGTPAADYDRLILTVIPGYEQMLSTIVWWLSEVIPANGRVIELGGGTGALSQTVLTKLPRVRMEIWDIDPKMLEVARERLRKFGDRVTFRERSFTERIDHCNAVIAT